MAEKLITIKKDLNKCEKIIFPVTEVRTFNENVGTEQEQITIYSRVLVREVPEDIWMDTNPREQNFNTNVAKKIEDSLLCSSIDNFHLLNRGILISAHHARVITRDDEKFVEVYLKDKAVHGNIDGGHTYRIICNNKNLITFTKRVNIEIMTGIEEFYEDLAAARNTSVQVQDKSIAELQNKFGIIKDALFEEPYYENIAYKENSEGEIDVSDIIAILTMFNIERFGDKKHPIISYNSKKRCVDLYLEDYEKGDYNPYIKMQPIMADIFALVDYIEANVARLYNSTGGKYGAIKGVVCSTKNKKFDRLFGQPGRKNEYNSPKGFLYPIIGAFRSLIKEEDGVMVWKEDPIKVFEGIGSQLIASVVDASKTLGNNPNATGKFIGLWESLYTSVKLYYLENK